MVQSTLEHAEGELEISDGAGSYMFAIAIIVLSLLSGVGLGAAYLNDQSVQPAVVMAAK